MYSCRDIWQVIDVFLVKRLIKWRCVNHRLIVQASQVHNFPSHICHTLIHVAVFWDLGLYQVLIRMRHFSFGVILFFRCCSLITAYFYGRSVSCQFDYVYLAVGAG